MLQGVALPDRGVSKVAEAISVNGRGHAAKQLQDTRVPGARPEDPAAGEAGAKVLEGGLNRRAAWIAGGVEVDEEVGGECGVVLGKRRDWSAITAQDVDQAKGHLVPFDGRRSLVEAVLGEGDLGVPVGGVEERQSSEHVFTDVFAENIKRLFAYLSFGLAVAGCVCGFFAQGKMHFGNLA